MNKEQKTQTTTPKRKVLKGVVVSDKMQDTAVVKVERFVKHPKYGKYIKRAKRYHAHNPDNKYHTGDEVLIGKTRPMSKRKHFEIIEIRS